MENIVSVIITTAQISSNWLIARLALCYVAIFPYTSMLVKLFFFFFFIYTATTEIYTLSLHDALPILLPDLVAGDERSQGLHQLRAAHRRIPRRILDRGGHHALVRDVPW